MANIRKYPPVVVDDIFTTQSGGDCVVIECEGNGTSRSYVIVKFIDYDYQTRVRVSELRRGHVGNPFIKKVFGVGYLGDGPYKGNQYAKVYNTWYNMFQRCYDEQFASRYTDCIVSEEWHNFQAFAEWYEKYYIDSYQLDKDVLNAKGPKVYSPSTCIYLPKSVNTVESILRNNINDDPKLESLYNKFIASVIEQFS